MQKNGKVLLDSGVQISHIRSDTDLLGLKGRHTSATIAKVGGEGETIYGSYKNKGVPNFQNINSTLTMFIFYFGFRLRCLVCKDI